MLRKPPPVGVNVLINRFHIIADRFCCDATVDAKEHGLENNYTTR